MLFGLSSLGDCRHRLVPLVPGISAHLGCIGHYRDDRTYLFMVVGAKAGSRSVTKPPWRWPR